jgi:hypothetical protein
MFKRDIVKIIRPGRGNSIPPRASGMVGPLPPRKKPTIPASGIMGPRHKKP